MWEFHQEHSMNYYDFKGTQFSFFPKYTISGDGRTPFEKVYLNISVTYYCFNISYTCLKENLFFEKIFLHMLQAKCFPGLWIFILCSLSWSIFNSNIPHSEQSNIFKMFLFWKRQKNIFKIISFIISALRYYVWPCSGLYRLHK